MRWDSFTAMSHSTRPARAQDCSLAYRSWSDVYGKQPLRKTEAVTRLLNMLVAIIYVIDVCLLISILVSIEIEQLNSFIIKILLYPSYDLIVLHACAARFRNVFMRFAQAVCGHAAFVSVLIVCMIWWSTRQRSADWQGELFTCSLFSVA